MSNTEPTEKMPQGIHYVYWFQALNFISFPLIIGMPMLLFFKKLDVSVTVLGVVAALPPLLNIIQIPAARYVEIVGYRRFVFWSWVVRTIFVAMAAGVAFLPSSINPGSRIALMLGVLFCYHLSRGISVCGILPWMTALVPEAHRAHYLSREQICGFTTACLTALAVGIYLQQDESLTAFGFVFASSFVAAGLSLLFLRRIPDAAVPDRVRRSSRQPVPWKDIIQFRPFRSCLTYNVVMLIGWSGNGVLIVPLLKDQFQLTDGWFMILNASWVAVFVLVLIFFGKLSDWAGSKPVLGISFIFQVLHFSGWGLVATQVLPFGLPVLAFQQITWGAAYAFYTVANTRLLMGLVPEMGRSHFFAIFSVGSSLTAGLAPVAWGMMADYLAGSRMSILGVVWTSFSWLYLAIVIFVLIAAYLLTRVEEESAMSSRALVMQLMQRSMPRLFPGP